MRLFTGRYCNRIMPPLESTFQAMLEAGRSDRPLHCLPADAAWMLFTLTEGAFRLLLRRGYPDNSFRYAFLEQEPELWQEAFQAGIARLDSSRASQTGRDLWVMVDRPAEPNYLLVLELPVEMGGTAELNRMLFVLHLGRLMIQRGLLPPWLDRMLPEAMREPSPLLLVSEEGSGSDRFVSFLLNERFGEGWVRFSPGRLAPEVQMREFYGDSTGERLRSSEVVPVVERSPVIVISEAADLAYPLQLRILSDLSGTNSSRYWVFETARDLAGMARAGHFDPALAEILMGRRLVLPPVRRQGAEVGDEAERHLQRLVGKYHRRVLLSEGARRVLQEYDWPGNLVELHATLEAAYLMSREGTIQPRDLKPGIWRRSEQGDLNLRRRMEEMEMQLILQAHALHGGNQVHMARALGISRGSLQYRLARIGLGD